MNNFISKSLVNEMDKCPQKHKLSMFTQKEIDEPSKCVPI